MLNTFSGFLLGLMIGWLTAIFLLQWSRRLIVQAIRDQINGRGTGPFVKAFLSSMSSEALAVAPGGPPGTAASGDGVAKPIDLGSLFGGIANAFLSGMNQPAPSQGGTTTTVTGTGGVIFPGIAIPSGPIRQDSASSSELKKVVRRSSRPSVALAASATSTETAASAASSPEAEEGNDTIFSEKIVEKSEKNSSGENSSGENSSGENSSGENPEDGKAKKD